MFQFVSAVSPGAIRVLWVAEISEITCWNGSISKYMSHMGGRATKHSLTAFWSSFGIAQRDPRDPFEIHLPFYAKSRPSLVARPPIWDMYFEIEPNPNICRRATWTPGSEGVSCSERRENIISFRNSNLCRQLSNIKQYYLREIYSGIVTLHNISKTICW